MAEQVAAEAQERESKVNAGRRQRKQVAAEVQEGEGKGGPRGKSKAGTQIKDCLVLQEKGSQEAKAMQAGGGGSRWRSRWQLERIWGYFGCPGVAKVNDQQQRHGKQQT